ncbi:DUF6930 domain-containing protein [Turicibacter sanguinis]|uniref:DUF7309 domain-containing protein n=1 Tax=Turicibacter sanguinis TaxID=154288 RepID=UPI0018ABC434|nr:hypothetical protein [Turicibacter sanguinis]MDB8552662.1 hypothetical protein [Turicibacter sanguinis]
MPTVTEWSRLYQASMDFKCFSPWNFMTEDELFAVQDPETNLTGFCCILGQKGKHLALNVYLGIEGLKGYLQMLELSDDELWHPNYFKTLWGQTCLVSSFEDRSQLSDKDIEQIKALGLKFKGTKEWPQFRDYKAGFLPAELEDGWQCRFLATALEQATQLANLIQTNQINATGDQIFIRVQNEQAEWNTIKVSMNLFLEQISDLQITYHNELEAYRIMKLPQYDMVFEVTQFLLPDPVQTKPSARGFFPMITAILEKDSKQLVLAEMTDSSRESYDEVLSKFARTLSRDLKFRPACLVSDHQEVIDVFADFCKKTKIPILKVDYLEAAHEFMDDLIDSTEDENYDFDEDSLNQVDVMMQTIREICKTILNSDSLSRDMSKEVQAQFSNIVELFHIVMLGNFNEFPDYWTADHVETACREILPNILSEEELKLVPEILYRYLFIAGEAKIMPNSETLQQRVKTVYNL